MLMFLSLRCFKFLFLLVLDQHIQPAVVKDFPCDNKILIGYDTSLMMFDDEIKVSLANKLI
jgi:hypothetical protein